MEDAAPVQREGVLLNLPASYWEQFLNDNGSLNKKALKDAGYDAEGQADWIHDEMVARGWIGGKKTAEDAPAAAAAEKKPARKK